MSLRQCLKCKEMKDGRRFYKTWPTRCKVCVKADVALYQKTKGRDLHRANAVKSYHRRKAKRLAEAKKDLVGV